MRVLRALVGGPLQGGIGREARCGGCCWLGVRAGPYDVGLRAGTMPAMTAPPWPELNEEDQWLVGAMERRLRESKRTPAQLRARASELRAQAEQTDIKGIRDAALALAAQYEYAAAERLAA